MRSDEGMVWAFIPEEHNEKAEAMTSISDPCCSTGWAYVANLGDWDT
jgi:hypothetical protein